MRPARLVSQLTRNRLLSVPFVIAFAIFLVRRARHRDSKRTGVVDPRPTLVFSGTFLLMMFILGVCAYIKDRFHLHNVRVSAISGGCIANMVLTLGLSPAQVLAMGMYMRKSVLRRPLLCYLMDEQTVLGWMMQEVKLAGLSDRITRNLCADPHKSYVGVTMLAWWGILPYPVFKLLPLRAETTAEALLYFIRSACVLPFFRRPSVFNGKWAFDGGFTSIYGVPDDADRTKVVKITPWPMLPADVKCRQYHWMHLLDFAYPSGIIRQKEQFILGYNVAKRHHTVFVEKGLIPYAALAKRPSLATHLDAFQKLSILRTDPATCSADATGSVYLPEMDAMATRSVRSCSSSDVSRWNSDNEAWMLPREEKVLYVVEEERQRKKVPLKNFKKLVTNSSCSDIRNPNPIRRFP